MSRDLLILLAASIVTSVLTWHFIGLEVFSMEGVALVLVVSLAVVGITIALALIPAGIYWAVKRRRMPNLSAVVWGLWVLVTLASLLKPLGFIR